MPINKKERTIEAYRKLISIYRDPPPHHLFGNVVYCPLCKVHKSGGCLSCLGCPNAKAPNRNSLGSCDISLSPTLKLLIVEMDTSEPTRFARANAIEKIIEILKDIPSSRFTVRGWKHFSEIQGL